MRSACYGRGSPQWGWKPGRTCPVTPTRSHLRWDAGRSRPQRDPTKCAQGGGLSLVAQSPREPARTSPKALMQDPDSCESVSLRYPPGGGRLRSVLSPSVMCCHVHLSLKHFRDRCVCHAPTRQPPFRPDLRVRGHSPLVLWSSAFLDSEVGRGWLAVRQTK